MFKFKPKEDNAVKRAKRKAVIEKAKTIALVTIFALAVGFYAGFKTQENLQAKYSKTMGTAQAAAPVAQESK